MIPESFTSRLLGTVDECPKVRTFRLSAPPDFTFTPGMFVMLHFQDNPKDVRAYSIASSPLEKGSIEITLNLLGDFTRKMFELKEGDALELKGPYGKWVYRDDIRQAALISDGTGIAPFRSMARYALAKRLPNQLMIFDSAENSSEIIYKNELAQFERAGIKVRHERPSVDLLIREIPEFSSTTYFLCGSKTLIDGLSSGLLAQGIPQSHIRYEKWGDY